MRNAPGTTIVAAAAASTSEKTFYSFAVITAVATLQFRAAITNVVIVVFVCVILYQTPSSSCLFAAHCKRIFAATRVPSCLAAAVAAWECEV